MDSFLLEKSDSVRYVLQYGTSRTITLETEPDGWKEDHLEIVRDKEYHGVFTQISSKLTFYGDALEYIKSAYETEGVNAKLYLIKYVLDKTENYTRSITANVNDTDVGWVIEYIGIADFETMEEEDRGISLNFNSNELQDIIDAHKTDKFQLERKTDLDGNDLTSFDSKPLDPLSEDGFAIDRVFIEPRGLVNKVVIIKDQDYYVDGPGFESFVDTFKTHYVVRTTFEGDIETTPGRFEKSEGGEIPNIFVLTSSVSTRPRRPT